MLRIDFYFCFYRYFREKIIKIGSYKKSIVTRNIQLNFIKGQKKRSINQRKLK